MRRWRSRRGILGSFLRSRRGGCIGAGCGDGSCRRQSRVMRVSIRQGRVPLALHSQLVDLVAERAPGDAVYNSGSTRPEFSTLDISQRRLQLLLGVGPAATATPHYRHTASATWTCHSWLRTVTGAKQKNEFEKQQLRNLFNTLFTKVIGNNAN